MEFPENLTRYLGLAQRLLARGRLPTLLLAVARKMRRQSGQVGRLRDDLDLLRGLGLDYWRGEYRALSAQALLSVVAGLVYFLMPLDAMPDWLLGVGLLDDLAVLAWVMRTWEGELQTYRQWRAEQGEQVLERVERLPAKDEVRDKS
ncbi:MAG TPA: DUF1232 domain-containing protein [Pseudomonas sp.]|nr:DUF1232 domain-containing protein [Pseudomonas sp.]